MPFAAKASLLLAATLPFFLNAMSASAQTAQSPPSGDFVVHLSRAELVIRGTGANASELRKAMQEVPADEREGMEFLIANMPGDDSDHLTAKFLLENVRLAYAAYDAAPWKASVSKETFLNEILPYASLNEERDGSRAMLREKSLPLIAGCKTPGEAAQALNRKLFPLVKVKYSTQRNRPDQAPTETIATGVATCSGLSILLVDACRAVGIPARIAGVPNWSDNRGNHTWVEVWDGDWHFAGAAEPDDKGLDHGWFQGDAAKAKADDPEHAVYATSFARTGTVYPLVWARENHSVSAVNVTERYVPASAEGAAADADTAHVMVNILDTHGKRVVAQVTVRDITNGKLTFTGESKSETSDRFNYLTFDLPKDHAFEATITAPGWSTPIQRPLYSGTAASQMVAIELPRVEASEAPLSPADAASLKAACAAYFAANELNEAEFVLPRVHLDAMTAGKDDSMFKPNLQKLIVGHEAEVRKIAWDAYRMSPIHADLRKDFDAHKATYIPTAVKEKSSPKDINVSVDIGNAYTCPYTVKTVGVRPANGWPLFIAMHGGGSGPKEMNDEQWGEMQRYYRDHPELGGYIYVAPRAPNDSWNGFYDVYIYPLIHNLVQQFTIFGDVDPNKVFLMGYSHGGYGAFAIGPKEPDLFAAVHASAAAPTDGETTAVTLRNTIFTNMVGGLDTAYGRLDRDKKFAEEINDLRGGRTDIYPVAVVVAPNTQHSYLKDRDKIVDMYPAVRNVVPRDLTWLMTDKVITDFFWLHTAAPDKNLQIDAACADNKVTVTTKGVVTKASVLLDSRLIDVSKPVTLTVNGNTTTHKVKPSLETLCRTMAERGDPDRAFTVELPLP